MQTLSVGRELASFTGVTIHVGQDSEGKEIVYSAGNNSGYVLDIDNPAGTQAMAYAILAGLKLRGAKYRAFSAEGSIIDPSSELGDGVTVNGQSGILLRKITHHSHLMVADVSAPYEAEVDHEFQYLPKTVREFKRESAYARSRISINANEIALEVVRATNSENTLGSRITLTADAITSEVTRATAAEGTLSTRIDQRLNSITLSVTSSAGSSVFKIMDGSTELSSETLDLSVKAVNVSGTLTASQIAAGAISIGKLDADAKSKLVVETQARTQYYLSTSSSSATGGSWSNTMPTWVSGKYLWTRERTYNKYADNSSAYTYSPDENGRYDKNLTESLETAASASTAAGNAQTSANSARSRSSVLYYSASGGTMPTAPSSWIDETTGTNGNTYVENGIVYGKQGKWTPVRPLYDSGYPALYVATQSETVGGTYSCTTPKLDVTTTIIDGTHIITGTIDADKLHVTDLSTLNATIGGWTINETNIQKIMKVSGVDKYRVRLAAPSGTSTTTAAIGLYDLVNSAWMFYVRYDGYVYAKNASIEGTITATAGTIGGVTISNGTLSGITDTNIATGGISGGSGGSIGSGTVTTYNTEGGINTGVDWGNEFGRSASSSGSYETGYFRVSSLTAGYISLPSTGAVSIGGVACTLKKVTISGVNYYMLGANR